MTVASYEYEDDVKCLKPGELSQSRGRHAVSRRVLRGKFDVLRLLLKPFLQPYL